MPVLDVLNVPEPDIFILEVSSFQMAITHLLNAIAGVVLNISPDHLDRHDSYEAYLCSKQRVYQQSTGAVINMDQPDCWQGCIDMSQAIRFSTKYCLEKGYSLVNNTVFKNAQPVLHVSECQQPSAHQMTNGLAALA